MPRMATTFEQVVAEGAALEERLADLGPVAVGGTAAALHCGHRFSLDVDVVTPRLAEHFAEAETALETWPEWRTNRRQPPVLLLGERHGVELGVRQQRRAEPLRTARVHGLTVATAAEMLRIKAFLLAERRMTRDFIDVAALAERLGAAAAERALGPFNLLYPPPGPQTWLTRFAEACEAPPTDLAAVDLPRYKGLVPPYTDWAHVAAVCQGLGRRMLRRELAGGLPGRLEPRWWAEEEGA